MLVLNLVKLPIYRPNKDLLSRFKNSQRYDSVKNVVFSSTKVKTLDQVIEEQAIKDVDFIKLDTQGSELNILNGGQDRVLSNLFGANIEVEFISLYKRSAAVL